MNNGIDTISINIRGKSDKLKELGWIKEKCINDIIEELI